MRIDWAEIDGHRVNASELTRTTEFHCDICGKFIAASVVVTMQVSLFVPGPPIAHVNLPQFDLHPDCVRSDMRFILASLGEQGITL